jgi:hypothetical protein
VTAQAAAQLVATTPVAVVAARVAKADKAASVVVI